MIIQKERKQMKKKLLVDFDSTTANSTETIFNILKEKYGFEAQYHNDYLWNFKGLLPEQYVEEALALFGNQKLYDRLQLMPNAYDVLKKLSEVYQLAICSVHDIHTVHLKDAYIQERLPFINERIYLSYDGKFSKAKIHGHIIVDDKISCLKGNREKKILFGNYGYNQLQDIEKKEKKILLYDPKVERADNWSIVESILL